MKLYEIYVREQEPVNRTSPIYLELETKVIDELPKEKHQYVMKEYSRENNQLLQIGVESLEAKRISVAMGNKSIELVRSKNRPEIWYEPSKRWIENGFFIRSESRFGMNACGNFEITAFDESDKPIAKQQVVVLPKHFTFQQYQLMQKEVKSLFEVLAFNRTEEAGTILRESQIVMYPIRRLKSLLIELDPWMNKIIENPMEQLEHVRTKKVQSQIKRWDSQAIIEKTIYPYREKISVRETLKDTNLMEHGMIRGMLDMIKSRILQDKEVEESMLVNLNSDLIKRIEALSKDNNSFKKEMELRCSLIRRDIGILEQRQEDWIGCLTKVEAFLEEPIFQVTPIEKEFTHLFSSEPSYMATFDLLEEIDLLTPKIQLHEQDFIEAMMNSPHLYEVWMLLQLIHQFRRLQFDCSQVWESLVEKYTREKKINGWNCHLPSLQNQGEFWIYYEPNLRGEDNGLLKPDYLICYRRSKSDIWQVHSLDAKYKPYSDFAVEIFEYDLERSCRRYYRQINIDNTTMRSAALVHIDKQSTHWNIDSDSIYKTSHFSVLPGELGNLEIYMTRLLHYFFELEEICPSCGKVVKGVKDKHKMVYICAEEGEVWVSNKCGSRWDYHRTQDIRLMKYASLNYNNQVQNNWDVHCPICWRDYNRNILNLNLFGNRINL
ncbi:hypothetical protein [Planococcus donghaensis]|nr:hypothetical protein [Planococcus donghaensis]